MSLLPYELYRAAQVRAVDRALIERFDNPGIQLMERAGQAAFDSLLGRWPDARRVVVFCGVGNNGGDGYVVARLARQAGLSVRAFQLPNSRDPAGDAATAWQDALAAGVTVEVWSGELPETDLVVDALLGTGLSGEVSGPARQAIAAINRSRVPVLALDIPSGLDADSGSVLGDAIKAQLTVTFIGLKQGLFTGDGPEYRGVLVFSDLGAPAAAYEAEIPTAYRMDANAAARHLAPRPRNAHKGCFGHVLVVGGDRGMAGAARIAAEAAARCGAGLVSVATHPAHASCFGSSPEIMVHGVAQAADLRPLLARATAVVLGPGLGRGPFGRELFREARDAALPLLLDADALNLLAEDPLQRDDWVLTPHPGEAARLLRVDPAAIQRDRFGSVQELVSRFGGTVVLKGCGSVVAGGAAPVSVCDGGNPGMASGGMGDLLSGVIAGLTAQGWSSAEAARIGVCLHAGAGDRAAAEGGERGLLATDLLPHLRRLLNPAAPR